MSDRLAQLSEAGVSIWLDDLSRERLETGNLTDLIKNSSVVGVTSNPTIFAKALDEGERYDAQVRELVGKGADAATVVRELTTTDVRDACEVFRDAFDATNGVDGRVSIEVSPDLANDTAATVQEAKDLWAKVDRPNLFIKIPATSAGWPAITETLAAGIPVNVTLIFGLDQYRHVMEAFIEGLDRAQQNGHDLSKIHSVASFFVSRVDTEIDKRLEAGQEGGADAGLRGKAGVANARLAYRDYEEFFTGERWERLKAAGATDQRPLWASTGVKNPDYADTMYVTDLLVPNTVNTMPEKTMEAFADHGDVGSGDQVHGHYEESDRVMADLADAGIDYDDVIRVLIEEGVEKFQKSWDDLFATVEKGMKAAGGQE
ncbi:MAG: transaldolase [Marmoricola sp.]